MTRQEQIKQAGYAAYYDPYDPEGTAKQDAFEKGAEWADGHPRWISVEDELPPQDGRYIFYLDTTGVMASYYYAGISLNEHVTHWMALPQPPKKGGEQ